MQDICLYYLAYLEEEASDGTSIKEYKELKKKLEEKGLIS